jgi:hypothetical protein
MIMVRTVFQTKWGKADEVVAGLAESMRQGGGLDAKGHKVKLLTDLSGEFHTVVIEAQYESLAAAEQFRARMFSSPEFQENARRGDDLMVGGRQEFYTIEAEF